MDQSLIADIIEIEQLLGRYAIGMTKNDVDAVIEVFTADGTYSAFGDTYTLTDFPTLVPPPRRGSSSRAPRSLDLDGDEGTGEQPLCFVDQTNHEIRRSPGRGRPAPRRPPAAGRPPGRPTRAGRRSRWGWRDRGP